MAETTASVTEELIVLSTMPLVAESPLDRQVEELTPNERFFIRTNFEIPVIDPARWRLTIGGLVRQPVELSLEELKKMPTRSLTATIECAGNGRSFLPQPWEGNPFGYGAVSAAAWTGVRLADVLQRAGVTTDARELVFVGADSGFEKKVNADIRFERSLPIDIALHPH